MARSYNYIYSRIVDGENDMIGNIAYSLYKTDKIKFIEDFKEKHGGVEPEEHDLCGFHELSSSESSINRYRMQAMLLLKVFLDDTLSSVTKQMEGDFVNKHQSLMENAIDNLIKQFKPKGYMYGVGQSILGAFIFMILMCALVFFFSFKDKSFSISFKGDGSATPTVVENSK